MMKPPDTDDDSSIYVRPILMSVRYVQLIFQILTKVDLEFNYKNVIN